MAHCKRVVGLYNLLCEREHAGGGTDSTGDAEAEQDGRPLNIREATAVLSELDTLCRAIVRDVEAAAAGPGTGVHSAYATARSVVWSAAITVLDLYSCPEHMRPVSGAGRAENGAPFRGEAELAMQVEAINGLKLAGASVKGVAAELLRALREDEARRRRGPWDLDLDLRGAGYTSQGKGVDMSGGMDESVRMADRISPLSLDAAYGGMATFHWLWRENGDPEMKAGLDMMKEYLEEVGKRWRLAGEYLAVENVDAVMGVDANMVG